MKIFFNLILLLTLFGCATGYHVSGFSGGYYDYAVGGKNQFVVGFDGNGYTASSTTVAYAHQRAKELCIEKGLQNYKTLNMSRDTSESRTPSTTNCYGNSYGGSFNANCNTSGGYIISKPSSELLIECY